MSSLAASSVRFARLAITTAVVELVNPRGAPLRAWVRDLVPGDGARAEVSPDALRMLAVPEGTELNVRVVHSGTLGTA